VLPTPTPTPCIARQAKTADVARRVMARCEALAAEAMRPAEGVRAVLALKVRSIRIKRGTLLIAVSARLDTGTRVEGSFGASFPCTCSYAP
jgi:hypothetical protein